MKTVTTLASATAIAFGVGAATAALAEPDPFRTMQTESWPTANEVRSALGAPGPEYWQQKVDYDIRVSLYENNRSIFGAETIVYHNNSPTALRYLWLSLDQNRLKADSKAELGRPSALAGGSLDDYRRTKYFSTYDGDMKIEQVADVKGHNLAHTVNDTFMRVELREPIKPGGRAAFTIRWAYNLADGPLSANQRTGFECLDGSASSCIYQVAQWFPRVAAFSDYKGWHLNPFLGFGSFALEMGDYRVAITVPKGNIVSATGQLLNGDDVLTSTQQSRLRLAAQTGQTVEIVTAAEAQEARDAARSTETQTWKFAARNVRDFSWSASRSFRWDASSVQLTTHRPLLMSFYPREGEKLWRPMVLPLIRHAITRGSDKLVEYPYPVFQAVMGPVAGFEYPMQIFVGGGRSEPASPVTAAQADGLASVIIHETTHSWFPIMLNSDEREWSWLDEGLNSFYQYEAQLAWRAGFIAPPGRGDPAEIGTFMVAPNQRTPMDRPDSLRARHYEGYGKAATALSVLRNLVIGPERFDRAMREYVANWQFRRPTAFDFFRSVSQSSGEDLDWFWRGWFFSTDHVDLAIKNVAKLAVTTSDDDPQPSVHKLSHVERPTVVENDPQLASLYSGAQGSPTRRDRTGAVPQDINSLYRFDLENLGGVPSPVPLKILLADETEVLITLPAEIWRRSARAVSWQYWSPTPIRRVEIDPLKITADSDISNNVFEAN